MSRRRDTSGDEPVSLGDAMVVRATEKALLVELTDHGEEKWVPKSVVHDDSEVYDDGENASGELIVKRWFAEKEQLA